MHAASTRIAWEHHRAAEKMKDRLRDWARVIKRDVHALYLASRDPLMDDGKPTSLNI